MTITKETLEELGRLLAELEAPGMTNQEALGIVETIRDILFDHAPALIKAADRLVFGAEHCTIHKQPTEPKRGSLLDHLAGGGFAEIDNMTGGLSVLSLPSGTHRVIEWDTESLTWKPTIWSLAVLAREKEWNPCDDPSKPKLDRCPYVPCSAPGPKQSKSSGAWTCMECGVSGPDEDGDGTKWNSMPRTLPRKGEG